MIGIEDDSDSLDGGFGGNDVDGILSTESVADCILAAIEVGQFLVLPHPQVADFARKRAKDHDAWIKGMIRLRRKALDRFGDSRADRFYRLV